MRGYSQCNTSRDGLKHPHSVSSRVKFRRAKWWLKHVHCKIRELELKAYYIYKFSKVHKCVMQFKTPFIAYLQDKQTFKYMKAESVFSLLGAEVFTLRKCSVIMPHTFGVLHTQNVCFPLHQFSMTSILLLISGQLRRRDTCFSSTTDGISDFRNIEFRNPELKRKLHDLTLLIQMRT